MPQGFGGGGGGEEAVVKVPRSVKLLVTDQGLIPDPHAPDNFLFTPANRNRLLF